MNVPHDFIVAPYNDLDAARALVRGHRSDLAAILVEPMLGAGGCIPGQPEFLHGLRALAQSMARELGPMNIHVAHVVIDGAIDTAFIRENFPVRMMGTHTDITDRKNAEALGAEALSFARAGRVTTVARCPRRTAPRGATIARTGSSPRRGGTSRRRPGTASSRAAAAARTARAPRRR